MATNFVEIYNRFLGQITDDLYVELTPEDTIKDLQNILIDSLTGFEFPRKNLLDYTINIETIAIDEVTDTDFVLTNMMTEENLNQVTVDRSYFNCDLTVEEEIILVKLMMDIWLQRQITSIENIRMKYSGADFKMTSQANHLSKLLSLQDKVKQQAHHLQRLYRRRRLSDDGYYESNWDIFKRTNYYYDD